MCAVNRQLDAAASPFTARPRHAAANWPKHFTQMSKLKWHRLDIHGCWAWILCEKSVYKAVIEFPSVKAFYEMSLKAFMLLATRLIVMMLLDSICKQMIIASLATLRAAADSIQNLPAVALFRA